MKLKSWYEPSWTGFEIQSLVFSILRKNLYPELLVRGGYELQTTDGSCSLRSSVVIFEKGKGKIPAKPILIIMTSPYGQSDFFGVPLIQILSKDDAYKSLQIVKSLLNLA